MDKSDLDQLEATLKASVAPYPVWSNVTECHEIQRRCIVWERDQKGVDMATFRGWKREANVRAYIDLMANAPELIRLARVGLACEKLGKAASQALYGLDAEYGQRVTDINFADLRPAVAEYEVAIRPRSTGGGG